MFKKIVKFFSNALASIQEARQLQANYEIAKKLQEIEYKNESIGSIMHALNTGSLYSLRK
jgi:hypothetical protein